MITPRRTQIASRKAPQQARSTELVAAILEAALQVLAEEGAGRFTTVRVAERAGASVGSLYQYFPNKAAILFRLQSEEWRRTSELLRGILEDTKHPPLERLRSLVHAFIRSECEEAAVRIALNDAAPLYRDAPEVQEAKGSNDRAWQAFVREMLPGASKAVRVLAGSLIMDTLTTTGKQFSEQPRTPKEIKGYADAMVAMFCSYLRGLQKSSKQGSGGTEVYVRRDADADLGAQ